MRNDLFLIEVGNRIKTIRKKKGITVTAIFNITGIARDNLHRIESGKKNFHILTIKSIAEAMGLDVKELL
jgi:transcriptional regulator with XRE-family HTH domain